VSGRSLKVMPTCDTIVTSVMLGSKFQISLVLDYEFVGECCSELDNLTYNLSKS